jgi:hypothetical protein
MSDIYGILNLNTTDNEREFINTIGQSVVFDAANEFLRRWSMGLQEAISVFVEGITPEHKERYILPGGGRLQRIGPQGPSAATKRTGRWDVAYPLEGFGASLAWSRVSLAYMTMQEFDAHLDTITLQATATVRYEMLKALLNNTQDTFVDPLKGSLSIEPLANGDAVTYPPVLGSESEATENHYLESGYAASAISDDNNPYETICDELTEHFGETEGGENIIVWINGEQEQKTRDLTDFYSVPARFVDEGANISSARPPAPGPGTTVGVVGGAAGCIVKKWAWIPENYMVAVHMDARPPLKQRRDPDDVDLPTGLTLVATDEQYPLQNSSYELRFGFGCGNRLNGVVMELGSGGSYDIPSGYS